MVSFRYQKLKIAGNRLLIFCDQSIQNYEMWNKFILELGIMYLSVNL
ncbi:unnamed protein product [Larinioides sclopetarius]|uniref:Uncharacterized protein n=1 Tax=Larinioides sclopetarius TaxID=280406 RepID=A0AAV2BMU7_9ARAC